ncbi:hypothetical protein [Rhodocaloribacter sp.]
MYAASKEAVEACLENLVRAVERLRDLDLTEEAGVAQALEASRSAMGALARYRESLRRTERAPIVPRRAA